MRIFPFQLLSRACGTMPVSTSSPYSRVAIASVAFSFSAFQLLPAAPAYEVKARHVETVMAEEPAPLPGMAPVRKEITITVDEVVAPPAPARAAPVPVPTPEAVPMPGDGPEPEEFALSATVYGHSLTLLHWSAPGRPEVRFSAWSNVDFNLFCGIDEVKDAGLRFRLMMGLGNEDAEMLQTESAQPPTTLPPAHQPAFVLTSGPADDAAGQAPMRALHAMFVAEGQRLRAEAAARETARLAREAHLRAHPPEPQDVHIRVWRNEPAPSTEP